MTPSEWIALSAISITLGGSVLGAAWWLSARLTTLQNSVTNLLDDVHGMMVKKDEDHKFFHEKLNHHAQRLENHHVRIKVLEDEKK